MKVPILAASLIRDEYLRIQILTHKVNCLQETFDSERVLGGMLPIEPT